MGFLIALSGAISVLFGLTLMVLMMFNSKWTEFQSDALLISSISAVVCIISIRVMAIIRKEGLDD